MKRFTHFLKKTRLFLVSLSVFTACLLIFNLSSSWAADAKDFDQLKFPPLPELQIPKYTRFTLKNGMEVYLMEDRELPLISGKALFRTGDRVDPPSQVGLASLTGDIMRTGGTRHHSPDELNRLLEERAASVETDIQETVGTATFNTLTQDLDQVFDLFAEVIQEPVFAPEKLELAKKQTSGAIARRNDDPSNVASREFKKLIYGNNSPYARTVENDTLKNISRQDLVNFYEKYIHPKTTILGVVGDFDTAKMRSIIEQKFGNWESSTKAEIPPIPSVSPAHEGGVFAVKQPQLNQSSILIGHLGGVLKSPDYPALSVLNDVLNSFGGRLFNNIRSRQGLAYSVYGVWSARYDYPGLFIAGGQTRSDATVPFIKAIRQEIERMQKEPITSEELAFAKESTLNSFIFKFEDPAQTLTRVMTYNYYGYPEDFIFQYRRQVEATTIADVQRVAQKYLKPEQMVTLVVGNVDSIQPPLTALSNSGKVELIDIATKPSAQM
jgi:zinc protease